MVSAACSVESPSNGTKTTQEVERFHSATADLNTMVASMKRNGGIVLQNFLPISTIDAIEAELRPYLDGDTPWDGKAFHPKPGVSLEQFLAISDAILGEKTGAWWGTHHVESESKAMIGGSIVFCVQPGAADQPLHRDDMQWHQKLPAITPEQYERGRDVSITLFVAGRRLTKENGATRWCPGSHLEQSQTPPDESKAIYAEMDKGDALLMLSSCYHGGSANITEDEERLVFSAFSCKGYLRQGENQYVLIGNEMAATWPDEILSRVGYTMNAPSLGFVDFMHPIDAIRKSSIKGKRQDVMNFGNNM